MAGIQIHTEDPIKPTKASGSTPQTAYNPNPNASSQPATTTAGPTQSYPGARPGAAVPTPTSAAAPQTSNGPPAPQPGAVPIPQAPMTTPKPSLPPPPKAGERPQPPSYYVPGNPQPERPQPYPPQMSQPPLTSDPSGLPPASITSASTAPSFSPSAPATSLPVSVENSRATSLEHPPGYVQNPYASDMTPDQRFATEQQQHETRSERLPSLGYNDNASRTSRSGSEGEDNVLEAAVKWGKETGKQLGDLHQQVWDSIGRK